MPANEVEIFYPPNIEAWREWLAENHVSKQSVWLVYYKKTSKKATIRWTDAVDMALCYGWIDSKHVSVDKESSHQFFSKRKAKSTWSKINKDKVEKLIEAGLMAEAGLKAIEIAKKNGSWNMLDEVEEMIVPADLENAFEKHIGSKEFFLNLSKSIRKAMLQWLVLAKLPETRQKRIDEIAELAAKKMKPKQF